MKKKVVKAAVAFLAVLLMASMIAGCASRERAEETEASADEIFVKTIHDFEGYHVENLDGQEDVNFAVYAQNTQEISMTRNTNVLTAMDEEDCSYTFSQPDDQLLALKPGDVFWAEASALNPEGLAVKVRETELSGEQITVYSDPVALEDLFTYVDIDMNLSLEQVYYDESQLEEGMEVFILDGNTNAPAAGVDGGFRTMSAGGSAGEGSFGATSAVQLLLQDSLHVDLGKSGVGQGAGVNWNLQAAYQLAVKQIRVQFKYSAADKYFFADAALDMEESTSYSVEFEGRYSNGRGGMGKSWPVFFFPIPGTPIKVGGEFFQMTTLSGAMKGSFEQSADFSMGFSGQVQNLAYYEPEPYCVSAAKSSDASLELEGTAEIMYGLRLDIGVPFVVDVFLDGGVGVRANGALDLVEAPVDEDSVHDCTRCLDGDVELFGKSTCGIDARLLSTITGYDLTIRKDLAEITAKVGDFYASWRTGEDSEVEYGWGECPHLRWRVLVTVLTQEGDAAEGATVYAQYPDGRSDSKLTDGTGQAEFFLPSGDNLLNCSHAGQRGNAHCPVSQNPGTATLQLEDKRQIFVDYQFLRDSIVQDYTDFEELYSTISQAYPDAQWIRADNWDHGQASTIYNNYSLAGVQEAYGVSPGDIIIKVSAATSSEWSSYVNGEYLSVPANHDGFIFQVGMALLPASVDGEPESDIPEAIWFYRIHVDLVDKMHYDMSPQDDGITYYLDQVFYNCSESYWQGLTYDSDYRIEEIGTAWSSSQWQDPAPTFGAVTLHDFYSNSSAYGPGLMQYVQRGFPYIELLLEDNWEEGLPEVTGEESGGSAG